MTKQRPVLPQELSIEWTDQQPTDRQTDTPAAYGKRPDGSAEAVPRAHEGDPLPWRGVLGRDALRC